MSTILDLINEMEDYFETCNKVPLSNKIVVNPEIIYEIITDMRLKLPDEIKKCQKVISEKDRIIMDAKKNAETFEKETENKMLELINEHEIMQQAYSEAEMIIEEARRTSRELKLGAYEYADEIISRVEETTKETIIETHKAYQELEDFMKGQLETLADNRQDLQNRKVGKSSNSKAT